MIPFNPELYKTGQYWLVLRNGSVLHQPWFKGEFLHFKKQGQPCCYEYDDVSSGRYLPEGDCERDLFLLAKLRSSSLYLAVSLTPPYQVVCFTNDFMRDQHVNTHLGVWLPVNIQADAVQTFLEKADGKPLVCYSATAGALVGHQFDDSEHHF